MNESHKWPRKNSSNPANNNGYNPDWATMARQWVELRGQQTQLEDPSSQIPVDGQAIEGAVQFHNGALPTLNTDANSLIPSYPSQYDLYLHQQVMHQQLLATANWASPNQFIFSPLAQYMVPDSSHLSQFRPQHTTTCSQVTSQYNSRGYSSHDFPFAQDNLGLVRPTLENTALVPPFICDQPVTSTSSSISNNNQSEGVTSPVCDKKEDLNQSNTVSAKSVNLGNFKQSKSIESEPLLNSEPSNCQQSTVITSVDNQAEKRPLEPYRKQHIPAMTINRSSTSQTNAKPVSKIPQWIREGLERIERERSRKQERERLEALEKEMDDGSPVHNQESPRTFVTLSPKIQKHQSPNGQSDEEVDEDNEKATLVSDEDSDSDDIDAALSYSRIHKVDYSSRNYFHMTSSRLLTLAFLSQSVSSGH